MRTRWNLCVWELDTKISHDTKVKNFYCLFWQQVQVKVQGTVPEGMSHYVNNKDNRDFQQQNICTIKPSEIMNFCQRTFSGILLTDHYIAYCIYCFTYSESHLMHKIGHVSLISVKHSFVEHHVVHLESLTTVTKNIYRSAIVYFLRDSIFLMTREDAVYII